MTSKSFNYLFAFFSYIHLLICHSAGCTEEELGERLKRSTHLRLAGDPRSWRRFRVTYFRIASNVSERVGQVDRCSNIVHRLFAGTASAVP